jgi:hypothetical protein
MLWDMAREIEFVFLSSSLGDIRSWPSRKMSTDPLQFPDWKSDFRALSIFKLDTAFSNTIYIEICSKNGPVINEADIIFNKSEDAIVILNSI